MTFNIFHAYENDKGDRVYVTEVVADFVQFLDPKPQGQVNQQGSQGYQQPQGKGTINSNLIPMLVT